MNGTQTHDPSIVTLHIARSDFELLLIAIGYSLASAAESKDQEAYKMFENLVQKIRTDDHGN